MPRSSTHNIAITAQGAAGAAGFGPFVTVRRLFASSAIGLVAALAAAPALAQADSEEDPDVIVITATGSQVELTAEYAGGQVARGARAGLLGNLDNMDSPFASLAYTENLIREQQAESIADIFQNDPTVRVARGFGNFQELYRIRGFAVFSDDMLYNGVYGILPRQFVAAEMLERVEVFRGANSFINGAAPGGSGVGGAVNLVPKRAPADPLFRATLGFGDNAQGYAHLDMARRFGAGDDFGVRANGVLRAGETAVDDQDRSLKVLSLGTDYQGDRLRFSADIGYQDHRIDAPRPSVTPLGEVPRPPDASSNFAQPWTYTSEEQLFGVVRGEYDVTDDVTAWAAVGGRLAEEANVLSNPRAFANGDTTAYRFDNYREDEIISADAGIRAEFRTGAIGHRVIASGSLFDFKTRNAYAFSSFAGFPGNLYDPMPVAPPPANFFVGGVLNDPLVTRTTDTASLALADMVSLFDEAVLATFGIRYQEIELAAFDYNTGAETSRYKEDAYTPAFGLVVKPTDQISIYGNYSESLVPGEVAPTTSGGGPVLNAGQVFPPYRAKQYEAGVKTDFGSFGSTLSAFQVTLPSAFVVNNVFSVAGEQRNRGIELSVYGVPVENVTLLGGLTLLKPELVNTPGGANDGNEAIGVPGLQANMNVSWEVPMIEGLAFDAGVSHSSSQWVNQANTMTIPSWTRLDLGARYEFDLAERQVTLRARLDNVTDEDYWASAGGFPGANYLVLGDPRTVFVSISVSL